MSTTLKITVTKEILEKSKMCGTKLGILMSENCAIAIAVRDIFPDACVGNPQILLGVLPFDVVNLPIDAIKFIERFDVSSPQDRVNMEPISFEIEIPDEVIAKINIDELRPLLINHPTLELVNH
jgi:hypothetical protein